jgi:type VI protein secretion system component Hcp
MNRFLRCVSAALLLGWGPAQAEIILCIAPLGGGVTIQGESNLAGYANCIQVVAANDSAFLDAGSPEARDLRISKLLDSASLGLRRSLALGQNIPSASFNFITSGGGAVPPPFWVVRLVNAQVTSMSMAATEVDRPVENLSFSAQKIEYTYRRLNPDGSVQSTAMSCWNLLTGTFASGTCP